MPRVPGRLDPPIDPPVDEQLVDEQPLPMLSAGEQSDLQLNGVSRSPLTGALLVADDYPHLVDLDALSEQARTNIAAATKQR